MIKIIKNYNNLRFFLDQNIIFTKKNATLLYKIPGNMRGNEN